MRPTPEILEIAHCLISEELRTGNGSDTEGRAAFRVCEKLRRPLSALAGAGGFRSLLSRAFALAKAEVPWLEGVQIKPDGSFEFPAEVEARLSQDESAKGGATLVAQLVGLLVTFIGEALTLRLVQDVWPKTALRNSGSGGNQS